MYGPYWRSVVAILAISVLAPLRAADGTQIAVALSSNAPAFEEALSAFKKSLGDDSSMLFSVAVDRAGTKSLLNNNKPLIAVAFGSHASEVFAASEPGVPLITTMVLTNGPSWSVQSSQSIATISLSVTPASILSKLRIAFPKRRRLAVLVGPNSGALRSELMSVATRLGYSLELIECTGPNDAIASVSALRGKVDFVWCLPDNTLFPSAAIAPLLLSAIKNQLPVIGFSEGFVRAGAAVGFYPDYADIGIQTADLIKRYLSKRDFARVEPPRKVRMAVNDRVLRILGMERPDLGEEVLVIR